MAYLGPAAAHPRQLRELEQQLASVTRERDELAKDVENLCLQNGSKLFSTSTVVNQRLALAEAEARDGRQKLAAAAAALREAQEDLAQSRDAKRASDRSCEELMARCDKLQLELDFYRQQSAKAMTERDQLTGALDEARAACVRQELQAKEAESRAASEARRRSEAEARTAAATERLGEVQAELLARRAECRDLPMLRGQLEELRCQTAALRQEALSQQDRLEAADLKAVQQAAELEEAASSVAAAGRAAAEQQACLEQLGQQVASHQAAQSRLTQQVQAAEVQLAAAQLQLERVGCCGVSDGTSSDEDGAASLADLAAGGPGGHDDRGLAEWRALAKRAQRECRKALRQVARQRRTHEDEAEQLAIYAAMVHDLKIKLANATQEKVEVLLRMAAASPGLEVRVNERYSGTGGVAAPGSGTALGSASCSPRSAGLHPGVHSLAAARGAASPGSGAAAQCLVSDGAWAALEARAMAACGSAAELRMRLERIEATSVTAHGLLDQLHTASSVLWSPDATPAKRWQAASQVARVQAEAAGLRKRLSLRQRDVGRRAAAAAVLEAAPSTLPPAAAPPAAVSSSWSFPELLPTQGGLPLSPHSRSASGARPTVEVPAKAGAVAPPPARSGGLLSMLQASLRSSASSGASSRTPLADARAQSVDAALAGTPKPRPSNHHVAAVSALALQDDTAPEADTEDLARYERMEHMVDGSLLDLVDFCVLALDTFSRASAMSSLAEG